ncbi:hypothetical protein N7499_003715 [Penicillium canescens]|nr:hypothetical protein N7499_003715 [Penicillium canescens]
MESESQEALGEDEALKVKLRGRHANQGDEEVEEREDVESIIEFETMNQAEDSGNRLAVTAQPNEDAKQICFHPNHATG